jgi:hypothetical protein
MYGQKPGQNNPAFHRSLSLLFCFALNPFLKSKSQHPNPKQQIALRTDWKATAEKY